MTIKRTIDPKNPYAALEYGLLEQTVDVNGKQRRFLAYIPEAARASTAGIFVLGANGMTAEELMENSGWKNVADTDSTREKMIVFFLEPENGVWNTQEAYGDASGDVAYINQVYLKATERLHYCVHEAKNYVYGEYEGATMAHMAVANHPAVYAGLVTYAAHDPVTDYIETCGKDYCTDLMGYQDDDHIQNRTKGSIPMPVWMIDAEENGVTAPKWKAYWCAANGTQAIPTVASGIERYFRTAETEYPINQDKEAYCVWHSNDVKYSGKDPLMRARSVWEMFLYRHRRWMADPGGSLRMTFDPVTDIGMEYHYEEIDGWMREWYVYVPESVKSNADKAVPLVFAMHGYSCSGGIYCGNSQWNRVADDRGFILVHPSALPAVLKMKSLASDPNNIPLPGWNYLHDLKDGPNEYDFFKAMIEKVCADHKIDRTRIYITGHSHGSMMTQALALGMPELFAAAAPCSGVFIEGLYDDFVALPELWEKDEPIPIWMFAGKQEGWLINSQPHMDNATGKTLDTWHKRNHLSGHASDKFENHWVTYRDRWNEITYWDNENRPMLKFTAVDYFPHATMPEMSYRIWDEFFSHWSREEDGTRRYF